MNLAYARKGECLACGQHCGLYRNLSSSNRDHLKCGRCWKSGKAPRPAPCIDEGSLTDGQLARMQHILSRPVVLDPWHCMGADGDGASIDGGAPVLVEAPASLEDVLDGPLTEAADPSAVLLDGTEIVAINATDLTEEQISDAIEEAASRPSRPRSIAIAGLAAAMMGFAYFPRRRR